MRTHNEWKVEISGFASDAWPSSRSTRSAISLEALLVKVTARIASGATFFSWMSQAMRCVITRVLPDPAPARISSGPSVASTAARCSGLRWSRRECKASRPAGRFLHLINKIAHFFYPEQIGDEGVYTQATEDSHCQEDRFLGRMAARCPKRTLGGEPSANTHYCRRQPDLQK